MQIFRAPLAVSLLAFSVAAAIAEPTLVKVTPTNLHGWTFGTPVWSGTVSTAMTVLGASSKPTIYNDGAAWLLTGSGSPHSSRAAMSWNGFAGRALGDFRILEYSTYISNTSVLGTTAERLLDPYMILVLDTNGDSHSDMSLTFEPRFNGPIYPGYWQQWSVLSGQWWTSATGPDVRKSLTGWVGDKPAKVMGVYIVAGAGSDVPYWNNKVYGVDRFRFQFASGADYLFDFASL
jgi:hypothetical protein